LIDWLADRGVSLVWLMGDHDPRRPSPLPLTCEVAGWTIGHGNRPISGRRLIFGHHHPVLRAGGLTAPCFLVGPKTIALPAFSPNAAGLNILSNQLPVPLRETPLRCVAGMGKELLDFGQVASLRDRLKVT
jgi:metallophosphoesterase superfamily enzyme